MRLAKMLLCAAAMTAGTGWAAAPAMADLDVVVTIKPIHSLVLDIMEGVGTPVLLVDGAQSPHTFSLKPSGAKALDKADVFIRVSPEVESFTGKLVGALPKSVQVITLVDTPGLKLLEKRSGATFEAHESNGHDAHGHGKPGAADATHDHGIDDGGPDRGAMDGHVWLDPENAKLIVKSVAAALAERSPGDAERLKANADNLIRKIDALTAEITAETKPLARKPFVVFHDAYQYFETRFGLNAVGSITVSPDRPPSAKRLTELRQKVSSLGATCVFAEPNLQPKIVATVIEGTKARAGTLDPEGTTIGAGPDHYATLMRKLAASLKECLLVES